MTTLPLGSETCDTGGRRLQEKERLPGNGQVILYGMEVREAFRVKIRSVGEFTDDRPQVPLNWIWLDGKRQILGEMKGSQNSLCVWVTIRDLGGGGFWVTD